MKPIMRLLCLLAIGMLVLAGPVKAQLPAITFDAPNLFVVGGPWSLGFQFEVGPVPIEIVALGYYQHLVNGDPVVWTVDHHVGIFDSAQNLLVDKVITSSSPLEGFFRWEGITPITLAANTTYFIAGTTGPDLVVDNPPNFQVNPAITFKGGRYDNSSSLVFPVNGPYGNNGWFGPNLKLRPTDVVPEPGTLAFLVGLGVGGSLLLRRRRIR